MRRLIFCLCLAFGFSANAADLKPNYEVGDIVCFKGAQVVFVVNDVITKSRMAPDNTYEPIGYRYTLINPKTGQILTPFGGISDAFEYKEEMLYPCNRHADMQW